MGRRVSPTGHGMVTVQRWACQYYAGWGVGCAFLRTDTGQVNTLHRIVLEALVSVYANRS
jgi:hypothetical protein